MRGQREMLALPVKLLTSVFAVALFSQCYDVYTTEYELHRVRTEKAVLYLTTEVCADPLVHAKLEEFNRQIPSLKPNLTHLTVPRVLNL